MPDMDGLSFLRQVRTLPDRATIPVIFLTGRITGQDGVRYRASGATGVIAKPYDPMALAAHVRALLARSR